jgi:hypothetical protein
VYLNGPSLDDDSIIRNFPVEREFLEAHPLRKLAKAESHRLGYENAEDAVSWNVFAGLCSAGLLGKAAAVLSGQPVPGEPELWLWGHRVDLRKGFGQLFPPLERLRQRLEPDVHPFATEPDIMLVVPGKLLILIEAKFTSGNSVAESKEAKPGEKPKDLKGLLSKYLPHGSDAGAINPAKAADPFHGQLFRNVVFAQAMAREPEMAGAEWAVVNLVSETQRKKARGSTGAGRRPSERTACFEDPTSAVHGWLREEARSRFRCSTWEALHAALIKGEPKLATVDQYLRGKSAHLRPAFELS